MRFCCLPLQRRTVKEVYIKETKNREQLNQPTAPTAAKLRGQENMPLFFKENISKASEDCLHSVQIYRVHSNGGNIKLFNCTGMRQNTASGGRRGIRVHLKEKTIEKSNCE